MDFANALRQMRSGSEMTRTAWDNPKIVCKIETGLNVSDETLLRTRGPAILRDGSEGYVYMDWAPSVTDILAYDWEFIRT